MSRRSFIALSLLLDAFFVNAGIVAAFLIRFSGSLPQFNFAPYIALAPVITAVYLAAAHIYGLYEPERTETPWAVVRATFAAATLATVVMTAIFFFAGAQFFAFSRLVIVISWLLVTGLMTGWRIVFLRFGGIAWPEQRVLLVGDTAPAEELAAELTHRERWGYRVVGILAGDAVDLTDVVAAERVDRVIVVSPVNLRELVESLALAEESSVRVDVVPELYEIFIGTVDSQVGDIPLMEITRPTVPPYYNTAKGALDFFGALVLIVLLSPVLLLAALAILVTMGAPVLFSQERVGKDMKLFHCLKFRTMVKDAEAKSGPVLAEEDDPRITPLGRILRRYRIDELPQLINILKGEMSFVGPRPERPFFVDEFVANIPGYRERFFVKPGVTGLAQVSGGYATTPERKLKYDLIYMYHQNLAMDVQVLVETVRVVLTGRGAR